jgi:hypothetical protein
MKNPIKTNCEGRWIPPWQDSREFISIMEHINGISLVDHDRCWHLFGFAKMVEALDGEMAEFGVYRGGTAYLLSKTVPQTRLHLFDTFAGLPDADPAIDYHEAGEFSASVEDTIRFLNGLNVCAHVGVFPESTSGLEDAKFKFVHVDCDVYRSVADACMFFYPRMVRGGIMVFDDYNWSLCRGVKKAVREFFSEKVEFPVALMGGQGIVIKQCEELK